MISHRAKRILLSLEPDERDFKATSQMHKRFCSNPSLPFLGGVTPYGP